MIGFHHCVLDFRNQINISILYIGFMTAVSVCAGSDRDNDKQLYGIILYVGLDSGLMLIKG